MSTPKPLSTTERLEEDASLAGVAVADGLRAVEATPYLLYHHFRGDHGDHRSPLKDRLRRAGRALIDLVPHRIVADAREHGSGR